MLSQGKALELQIKLFTFLIEHRFYLKGYVSRQTMFIQTSGTHFLENQLVTSREKMVSICYHDKICLL